MSGNLDKSLDDIVSARRGNKSAGRGRGRRAPGNRGPAGGIKKAGNGTAAKPPAKKAAVPSGVDTKILVSNLPTDVTEAQIKEYFGKATPVRKVTLTYGPNGVSRGIATIIFGKPGAANEAAIKYNGILVDNKPMRVEVIVDASRALVAEAKNIADRISAPKSQAKKATAAPKDAAKANTNGNGNPKGKGPRKGRSNRPQRKTADQLDTEMDEYWNTGNTAAPQAAAPVAAAAPANGNAMDDIA